MCFWVARKTSYGILGVHCWLRHWCIACKRHFLI